MKNTFQKLIVSCVLILLLSIPLSAYADSNAEAYGLQERCAKRAAMTFEHSNGGSAGQGWFVNYENHYNRKLNKCFYLEKHVKVMGGKWTEQFWLLDVNDNKEYGSFFSSDDTAQYTACSVKDATGTFTNCSSKEDWEKLVKQYMED